MAQAERDVRWEWVVVLIALAILSVVATFGWLGRGIAVAGAYGVGRWDSQ